VEGSCEHGNEPSDFIKYWEVLEFSCTIGGFSRRVQLHDHHLCVGCSCVRVDASVTSLDLTTNALCYVLCIFVQTMYCHVV
jgi:hypothetical protein